MKGMFTEEQLKNLFIEDVLAKGYIPINIGYYQYPTHDRVQANCAFFGKKEARRRYSEIQNQLSKIHLTASPVIKKK